jgi:hypothetical protein
MDQDKIEFIVKIVTAIIAILAFLKGLNEFQKNNRIKRAEFLEKLIIEFLESKNEIARHLLDDYVYVSESDRNLSPEEQKKISKTLTTYLRNHKTDPIRFDDEIKVRKSFDNLFDFFTKLSYYLNQKIITPAEISYFRYYLEKIESKPEVIGYINTYYYLDDFNRLFATFKGKTK